MPTLSFSGETHDEIVQKVRRWLASVDGDMAGAMGAADVINQSAELTKDALRVVAQSAPGGIGESELIKALTTMGYRPARLRSARSTPSRRPPVVRSFARSPHQARRPCSR